MLLRKLIAFAITSGLAKKAWDHYREPQRPLPGGHHRRDRPSRVQRRPRRAAERTAPAGSAPPARGPKLVTAPLRGARV